MANISGYDYTNIPNNYNNFLERNSSIPRERDAVQGVNSPTDIKENALDGNSFNDLYIKSWIKSRSYKPKKQGFLIDGRTGRIECMDLFATGKIEGSSLHIPNETIANSFHVDSEGNMWLGCNVANFNSDNDNAKAYILKTGVAKFQDFSLAGDKFTMDSTGGLKTDGEAIYFRDDDGNQMGYVYGQTDGGQGFLKVIGSDGSVDDQYLEIAGGSILSLARRANGQIWAWGNNSYGELGNNSTVNKSSPVLVVGDHSFVGMVGGYNHSSAHKTSGQAWSWGRNNYGQLGDNSIVDKSSPILVVGNHSFVEIAGGAYHCFARKSSGEVWSWGYNNSGQLGNNNDQNKSSPVLVVGNHSFVEIMGGLLHSFARKVNGQVWTWGLNGQGQLGDNTITAKSSPVLVVGNHSFVEMIGGGYHSIARKINGEIWTWGRNSYGQLGDNTIINKSSPILVVGSHSFVEISAGSYYSLARKANGQVWAWGRNNYGQLGDNSITSKSSPVLVVGNHSFAEIAGGDQKSIARKTNGEIWGWGYNNVGQLGDNTTINKSSPALVVGGSGGAGGGDIDLFFDASSSKVRCKAFHLESYNTGESELGNTDKYWGKLYINEIIGGFKIIDKQANYTVLSTECGGSYGFSNDSATGTVEFTLPTAVVGYKVVFLVAEAQLLAIIAGTGDKIYTPDATNVDDIKANVKSNIITLYCINNGEWLGCGCGTWNEYTP